MWTTVEYIVRWENVRVGPDDSVQCTGFGIIYPNVCRVSNMIKTTSLTCTSCACKRCGPITCGGVALPLMKGISFAL